MVEVIGKYHVRYLYNNAVIIQTIFKIICNLIQRSIRYDMFFFQHFHIRILSYTQQNIKRLFNFSNNILWTNFNNREVVILMGLTYKLKSLLEPYSVR